MYTGEFVLPPEQIEEGKAMAAVAYLGLPGFLVAYLTSKENRFVLYHAQQSLVLILSWMLVGFLSLVSVIPFIGWILFLLLWLFVGLPLIALLIVGIVNASGGQVKPLPVLGRLALKFGLLKPDGQTGEG